jgi:hypothetical protein
MREAMTRGVGFVGALVTALIVLSGCASVPSTLTAQVPTSGPIEQGAQIAGTSEDQFIRVIARPPREGMTPSQIVQGFLEASASFDGDHAVARQYLTPDASNGWDTSLGVAVYEGIPTLSEFENGVSMVAPQSGAISDIGTYSVLAPGSELRTNFGLDRVNGEWRIARVPEGLLLSLADVDRAFRSYSLYFFNASFTTLVPDPRMIPVIGSGLASTLVRRLIEGPSEWLEPAVRTGFPDGAGLAIDAVLIESGVAQVQLDAAAQLSDDRTRQALSQQLVWTLRQLPEVQAVEITAGGQPLIVPGALSPQPRDSWPSVDPSGLTVGASGYAITSSSVVRIDPTGISPAPGEAGLGTTDGDEGVLVDIAVDRLSQEIAGFDSEGTLWRGPLRFGAGLSEVGSFPGASALQFDPSGALWLIDSEEGLLVIPESGEPISVTVQGLASNSTVQLFVPSRDGTRAAVVVQRGPRTTLFLARIIRPSQTNVIGLVVDAPIRVEAKLAEVVDASWSSAESLAVLGSESAGSLQVYEVDLARGQVSAQGTPEAPVAIAAAPGLPTLTSAADGILYEGSSGSWSQVLIATSPAYPG